MTESRAVIQRISCFIYKNIVLHTWAVGHIYMRAYRSYLDEGHVIDDDKSGLAQLSVCHIFGLIKSAN